MPPGPDVLRVLVVDDEPLARQRVLDLLDREADVDVVGTAGTGRRAVQAIAEHAPDLVFLDVQMPGLSGLDVVREVGPEGMPAVVFVTAYDQHALAAFDVAAIDYLLKPYDDARFRQSLDRARRAVRLREVDALRERLTALFGDGDAPPNEPLRLASLERIAVEMRGQTRLIPVEDIDYLTSDGPYVELHVGGHTHVLRERMQTLEDRLDADRFFRIHRSTIVQVDRIEALLTAPGGDYAVRLKDGTRLRLSRSRRDDFTRHLGIDALE